MTTESRPVAGLIGRSIFDVSMGQSRTFHGCLRLHRSSTVANSASRARSLTESKAANPKRMPRISRLRRVNRPNPLHLRRCRLPGAPIPATQSSIVESCCRQPGTNDRYSQGISKILVAASCSASESCGIISRMAGCVCQSAPLQ